MPAGFIRLQRVPEGNGVIQKFQSWYVPIDDEHTKRFQVGFVPTGKEGRRYEWRQKQETVQPGPDNDYFRNYEGVDTICGIPGNAPGTAVKGFLCQDNMVNESQGPIVDRRGEHLVGIDKVLVAMRSIYFIAIEDLKKGRDPKHIIRDTSANEVVYVRGTEELELA
jgi:hypothetical protein